MNNYLQWRIKRGANEVQEKVCTALQFRIISLDSRQFC